MQPDRGEVILYQSDDGQAAVDVCLADETVWLTQSQMVDLFQRDQSVLSRHVNNVFKEGELLRQGNMQKMHIAHSDKPVVFYNLDVIISVGYRVKSKRGTQFRIRATSILKDHLVKGYTFNQRHLAEKGILEAQQVLSLLTNTLGNQNLVSDEGLSVFNLVNRYAKTWQLLLQYDEDKLPPANRKQVTGEMLDLDGARAAIGSLKQRLLAKMEATDLFGNKRIGSFSRETVCSARNILTTSPWLH